MRYGGFCKLVIAIDPMLPGRSDVKDFPKGGTARDRQTLYKAHPADQKKIDLFNSNTKFLRENDHLRFVQGCSSWQDVHQHVGTIAEEAGGIDILVIDGCHHPYEMVWEDFVIYFPMVNDGGLIIFDDIYESCIRQAYDEAKEFVSGVHEEWKLENEKELQEIGVLRK